MANFFYNSTGSNTAPYDTWAKASTSLATVAAAMAAGDTLFVGDNSNEIVAGAITATFPGTAASPNFIYVADHTVATPATGDLKIGAAGAGSVTTSTAGAITIAGSFYCFGLYISGNAAISLATGGNYQRYEACTTTINSGSGTSSVSVSGGNGLVEWINCTLTFTAVGQNVNVRGRLVIRGGALTGTAPTTLFAATAFGSIEAHGWDYSILTAGKTLVGNLVNNPSLYSFVDCKEGAGFTRVAALTGGMNTVDVTFTNTDSGATNYQGYKYNYAATQSVETTIIRTGGAQQPNSTGISNKIVATANSKFEVPFRSLALAIWNPTTGANVTVTVHGVGGAAGLPNNDDVWLEVEYLGAAGTPLGSIATNTKNNNLATGAAYSASGATWAGSPAGTPFAMAVTLGTSPIVGTNGATTSPQPGMVGVVLVYVCVAKASATYYIDPLPILS